MDQFRVLMPLAVAGALLLAGCGDKTKTDASAGAPAQPGATSAGAGVSAGLTVAVKSVRQVGQVGGSRGVEKAADGNVLVVLDYTVTNTTAAPIPGWRQLPIKLVDNSGTAHDRDMSKTLTYQLQDDVPDKVPGDFAPGAVVSDAAVFEAPKAGFDPATWFLQIGEEKIPVASAAGKTVKGQ